MMIMGMIKGMIKGQCLCGRVKYLYHAEIKQSILCFCQDCQLAQGSIMGWNSPLLLNAFEITSGQAFLKQYFNTPNKARVFCRECGSPIYSYRLDLPEIIRLRLGAVTEGLIPPPDQQFYITNQPSFIKIQSC